MKSHPAPDVSMPRAGESRRRFLLSMFVAHFITLQMGYSQRWSAPFSTYTDTYLAGSPSGLALSSSRSPHPAIVVATRRPNTIQTYTLTDTGTVSKRSEQPIGLSIRLLWSGDLNRDGATDCVGLAENGSAVALLIGGKEGFTVATIPVIGRADRLVVADIDNDRVPDILLFGKTIGGISVLHGRKGGTFEPAPELFSDVSVIDAAVTDLNGDGIADVFLLNWLSNTLQVSFGISRGIFSGQVEINLGADPGAIALSPVTKKRTVRVAVALPSEHRIVIFTGNGAGEFSQPVSLPIPGEPGIVQFASLDGDAVPDLLVSTDKGIVTAYGRPDGSYLPPIENGVGQTNDLWRIADLDGDRKADLVGLNVQTGRLFVVANGGTASRVRWAPNYLVGPGPHGVALVDANGDGRMDVLTANSSSSTVSLLLGKADGKLDPQRTSQVGERPRYVYAIPAAPPAGATIILSHPESRSITIVRFPPDGVASAYSGIPTAADPYVLAVKENASDPQLQILVKNRRDRSRSWSFSLFEQLGGSKFLERSYQAEIPTTIRSLSVGRISNGGDGDILFLSSNRQKGSTTLSRVPGRGRFSYSGFDSLYSFDDPQSDARFVYAADLNRDGSDDVLLGLAGQNPALGVLCSNAGKFEGKQIARFPGVRVAGQSDLAVCDADGDGITDIVALDESQKGIVFLAGLGGGRFAPPRVIARSPDPGGFAVGSLRTPGMNDLVVTDYVKGSVEVFYDPF